MFNPAKASENIKNEFIDYISTNLSFSDEKLQEQLVLELNKSISKGPYLEINDVFEQGLSIDQLIEEGVISKLFRELEANKPHAQLYKRCIPLERPLYLHQEKAIRKIVSGKNAVISTGTGSGKTNCFLIPIINELLKEKENGTLGPGVRAMLIYPMNALANDQMKNIRKILMYYPDITFGMYNGETEYNEANAISVYKSMFANEKIPELKDRLHNEILSRDEMKSTPPNILFTNYSMLEHLLFRPQDDVIFSNADFKFVVLDEAHVYTGATGIETSLLLRRLKARISRNGYTQFILTSATLGSDSSCDDDIIQFAKNLCGEEFSKDCIIRSTRETYTPNGDFIKYPSSLYKDLADESRIVKDVLTEYKIQFDDKKTESELLYDFILSCDLYKKMRTSFSGITDIGNLKNKLDVDIDTAISFISICSRANKNGKNLLDARFHFFVRALEGCFLSSSPAKQLFLTRRNHSDFKDVDYSVFEVAVCEDCGKYAFVGKIKDNKLLQVNNNTREEEISYFFLSEEENDDIEDDEIEEDLTNSRAQKQEKYALCTHCSTVYSIDDIPEKCTCGYSDFLLITRAKSTSRGAKCGNCHVGLYKRFYLGGDAATSVLATSLYEELPEIEYKSEEIIPQKKNIFLNSKTTARKVSQKSGRQFLCFSDSRQEAAKFACYLEKSYDEFLRRRGICQVIDENKSKLQQDVHTISDYVGLLTNNFTANKSFAKSNFDDTNLTQPSKRNAWVAMLNELARFNSKTSLTSLGILQFSYLGNTEEVINNVSEGYNAPKDVVQNLLDLLAFEIVKKGAIRTDKDSDINDDDREYIFYSPSQRFIKKNRGPELSSSVSSWMPKTKIGKQGEYYRTNILYYVMKSLNIDASSAYEFLEQYFVFLVDPENEYHMEDINHDGTYVMPAKYFQVKIPRTYNTKWYKCKKCGKVSQFSIRNHCSTVRCDGLLEEIQPEELSKNNHYAKLYFTKRMSPLFIKEHTAQLNKKESAEYQEQFVRKEINALSCSTTFEMGVDVGDLETVFLRDVPPLPSNYAQRAGRAGRSVDATAYALTFAKLSSHDLSFFKNPEKMIQGTILPPLFKIDNEKIVRRHIYAIALSMFFSKNPKYYNKNDAELFLNEKKYLDFIVWLESKPLELDEIIKKSIPDINDLYARLGIDNFTWIDDFIGADGILTQLVNEYESNIKNFEKLIKENRNNNIGLASIYEKKLKAYTNNKLIDFLARGNVLPKYGFPADTVELKQNTTAKNVKKLSLTRDLQVAIAEYAPSSEIVADGRLYTSRYIAKDRISNNNKEWHTAYIATCTNECCRTKNYSLTPIGKRGMHCISCDTILDEHDFHESIEPRNGFITDKEDKDVPMRHQEKNYKSEDYYIGNKLARTIEKYYYRIDKTYIKVESTTNDSMMVESSTSFYVCPYCGYAISADEATSDIKLKRELKKRPLIIRKEHQGLYKERCDCRELQRKTLHHVFNTDVAKISFSCDSSNYETMISTLYALLYSISEKLNIERRDLKACLSLMLKKKNNKRYSIIIYDSVPGGAGHSRRLATKDGKELSSIFHEALDRVNGCNCNPSCYNCLRSYDNQRIHDVLDRTLASKFLQQFEGEFIPVDEEEAKEFF